MWFLSKQATQSCYINLITKYLYFAFRSVVLLLMLCPEHTKQMWKVLKLLLNHTVKYSGKATGVLNSFWCEQLSSSHFQRQQSKVTV